MSSVVNVAIHESQSPENVRRDLLESLRTRRVNHKFHYDSIKQTNKWLALHQMHSPSRNDIDCSATYDRAFVAAVKQIKGTSVHLVGLGCGGGQKDTRLLTLLAVKNRSVSYTPSDVSVAMTLVARQASLRVLPPENIFPFVCDLAKSADLSRVLATRYPSRVARLFTFFGMIPNFEPHEILPKLAALVRRGDVLLFSANLAPGDDYRAGMKTVLPQYNNALTRDWLLTFLSDLGVTRSDGALRFSIDRGACGLRRIAANFYFSKPRTVSVEGRAFNFRAGAKVRLFFSYRYTPALVKAELTKHNMIVTDEWITNSGEEGVFLCSKK